MSCNLFTHDTKFEEKGSMNCFDCTSHVSPDTQRKAALRILGIENSYLESARTNKQTALLTLLQALALCRKHAVTAAYEQLSRYDTENQHTVCLLVLERAAR